MRGLFASAWVGAVFVAAATAGCTTAATTGPTVTERAHESAERGGPGRELTDAEEILVQRAEQILVKECMEKAGFTYWLVRLPAADEVGGDGYVLTDVAWARKHGYGSRLRERLQAVQRDDPNHAYANALPDGERRRYDRTLEGGPSAKMLTVELPAGGSVRTPRHSCLTEAKERLYGDFATWFRAEKTATNLTDLYVPDLLKDERLADALDDWSACMRRAGHDYADPPAIRARLAELAEDRGTAATHATEIGLAVAEAECATKTSLSATAHALDDEYRDELRDTYGDAITTYERMSLRALRRAEEITGRTA